MIALLLSAVRPCFTAEKKLKDTTHFELYFDDEKTAAARVTTPLAELRTANRPGKSNFAAAVSTAKLLPRLPLSFRAGNLSAGGSLSLLNSPELSSGSTAFTQSLALPAALSTSLPGSASYTKPVSAFFEARYTPPNKSLPSLTVNLWLTPDAASPLGSLYSSWTISPGGGGTKSGSKAQSAGTSQSGNNSQSAGTVPQSALTLSASFTTGLFNYESNDTGSWFLKSPYYPASTHSCSLFQLGALLKKNTTSTSVNLAAALYESPFGFYQLLYRSDIKIIIKHLEFFSQFFYNPYDQVLTSSQKVLTPCFQAKGGLVFKSQSRLASIYLHTPVFFKFGLNAYCRINLTEKEHPLKFNSGIVFTTGPVSTTAAASLSASLLSTSPLAAPSDFHHKENTCQLKSSWKHKAFTPSLAASLTIPRDYDSKKTGKFSASTGFTPDIKKLPLTLNAQAAYTFTIEGSPSGSQTTGLNSGPITPRLQGKKLTASLTARLNFRRLTVTGKISADIALYLE